MNLKIKVITKSQYDILENTHGVDLYEEFTQRFEGIENHGGKVNYTWLDKIVCK